MLEYVAKTKGAEHLKSSTAHMSIVQYYGVDLLALIAIVGYIALKAFKLLSPRWHSETPHKTVKVE